MDYFFLFFAVVCFTAQFAFTKLFEEAMGQSKAASMVMLAVTNAIGFGLFFCLGGFRIAFTPVAFLLALAMGLIMIPYYLLGIRVLSLGSLAVYSMFMMLGGMLVPFFYGLLFLEEAVSWGKGLGTVLLALCMILQATLPEAPEKSRRAKGKKGLFFALCILIFFINGFTGVIAKAHQISAAPIPETSFTALSCGITGILSGVLLAAGKGEKKPILRAAFKRKPLGIMVGLGVSAYTGSFLHLMAAETVPASVQFPLVSGGVIVLSALASAWIFKEKVTRQEWLCVSGAFLATCLFAF